MPRRRGTHEGYRYRRKDGLHVGRVQFEGKRHQISSANARERDRLLRELIRDLEAGKTPSNLPRRKTLGQVVAEWLEDRRLTRPATYPTWKSYSRHLSAGDLAGLRVGALTTVQITAFYAAKLDAGYAQSTVRQIHRTLVTCLNWAVGQDVPVPAAVLKMTAPAVDQVDRVQLTPAQVGLLFRTSRDAGDPLEALWRLVWYCSARLGELLALSWDNAGRGGDRVRLVRVLVGVRDGEPRTRPGKTRSSQADLAVPPDAIEALRRHWLAQEGRRTLLGAGWKEPAIGRLVFDRGDGGAFRHEQVEQAWYAALETAGLPRCRVHDLRGASLSALREAGHDVLDVQKRARHASVQTTLDSYVRGTDAADARAAQTLERLVHEAASEG
jgi:integrase